MVASWWPWRYWAVSTFQTDNTSPLAKLTQSIKAGKVYDQVVPEPNNFATTITRCDKNGWNFSDSLRDKSPVFVREYKNRAEAEAGHKQVVDLLTKGRLQLVGSLEGRSEEELRRWLHLRAIEWNSWPSWLSAVGAPVLFIFFPWLYVVSGLLAAHLVWMQVRYRWVSPALATVAALVVTPLQWVAAIGCAGWLYWHNEYFAGTLALCWPLLAGIIPQYLGPTRPIRQWLQGEIGRVELALAKRIGYVDQDAKV